MSVFVKVLLIAGALAVLTVGIVLGVVGKVVYDYFARDKTVAQAPMNAASSEAPATAPGAAAAVLAAAWGPAMAPGAEPAAQRLVGQEPAMLLGEDVGQVAEVERSVGGGGQVEARLLACLGGLVGRGACGVAVDEALGAVGLAAAFEALDRAAGET